MNMPVFIIESTPANIISSVSMNNASLCSSVRESVTSLIDFTASALLLLWAKPLAIVIQAINSKTNLFIFYILKLHTIVLIPDFALEKTLSET